MALKTFAEFQLVADRDAKDKIKWPLECGCKGADYYSRCDQHKLEFEADAKRLMGIPELIFTHQDFHDLHRLGQAVQQIRLHLIRNREKPLLIKINSESR